MDIEKYLEHILTIPSIIKNKQIEREIWFEMAQGGGSGSNGDRVQSSGDQQRMANAVAKYSDVDAEIQRLQDELIDFVRNIEQLVEVEYGIMHDIYIKRMKVAEICAEEKKSDTWVRSNLKKAKANLKRILEGDSHEE